MTVAAEAQTAVRELLLTASAAISAGATHPVETTGAALLAGQLTNTEAKDWSPERVAVVAELDSLASTGLLDAVMPGLKVLPWIASPRTTDGGTETALAMLNDTFDLGELGMGVIMVGAGCEYPLHHHPPAEVYLVLGGDAEWRWGGAEHFAPVAAGSVIHNNPDDVHAIRAGEDPVVALWVLFDGALVSPTHQPHN